MRGSSRVYVDDDVVLSANITRPFVVLLVTFLFSFHIVHGFHLLSVYSRPALYSELFEAHSRLFDIEHSCVELQHEHEHDGLYCNGNDEPYRGFGHLAFLTDDVYKASEDLEKAGVGFKKRPGEFARVLDTDT